MSQEFNYNMAFGKPKSQETKDRMRQAQLGNPLSEESKYKIRCNKLKNKNQKCTSKYIY